MTLPAYTPTPFETDAGNADAEETFDGVADVTDANFAKVTTYTATRRDPLFWRSYQLQSIANYNWPSGSFNIPPAYWAPIGAVIPTRPAGLLITIGAQLYHNTTDQAQFLQLSVVVSGATNVAIDAQACRIICARSTVISSVSWFIPGPNLTPGGTVTITPNAYFAGPPGNVYGNEVQIVWGELHAVALL